MNMTAHLKTLLTLGVLSVLVLLGLTWGWSAMTSPFPQKAAPKVCIQTALQVGDRVSAPQVTVSVFNASTRVGLAERTMANFEDMGFGLGKVGNAPKGTDVSFAQVWTSKPNNPAVQLVVSRLGPRARAVHKHHKGPGVIVVVGPAFEKLVAGKSSIKVTEPANICSPPSP
jgi:LytR cell envelope-related transcriptional attenuator